MEKLVAEKSWWHKNCFRCKECNKVLNLDTYASHQGVIYCKAHHKELFMPKAVEKDSMEEIMRKKKNVDFSVYENGETISEKNIKLKHINIKHSFKLLRNKKIEFQQRIYVTLLDFSST